MMIVEGDHSFWVGTQALLVEEGRELAWAEPFIQSDPHLRWILGRYVEAETPNLNGHIFPASDMQAAVDTIPNKPLNMLHFSNRIVGHYVAGKLLTPTTAEGAGAASQQPFAEALSCFYAYYFPEQLRKVEKAHADGALSYSMEAIPASLSCVAEGCGHEAPYQGRTSAGYCAHLNKPGAQKRLNQPNFIGGALILPPASPAWSRADVTEMTALMEERAAEAAAVYDAVSAEFPHLDAAQWEMMMQTIVQLAVEHDKEELDDPKV